MTINKEINYLSLPDYFNKNLLTNYNQKINFSDSVNLQFRLSTNHHLGSALKAIYLLEIFFPRKSLVIKTVLKKKKLYFGQKTNNTMYFNFNVTLSTVEFVEFFRFFSKQPLKIKNNKISDLFFINRKLKQFEFDKNIFIVFDKTKFSFFFLCNYHLN